MKLSKLHSLITTELGVVVVFFFTLNYFNRVVYYNNNDLTFISSTLKIFIFIQLSIFIILLIKLLFDGNIKAGIPASQLIIQCALFGIVVLSKELSLIYLSLTIILGIYSYKVISSDSDVYKKIFKHGKVFKYLSKKKSIILGILLIAYLLLYIIFYIISKESIDVPKGGTVLSNGVVLFGPLVYISLGQFALGYLGMESLPKNYYRNNTILWLVFNVLSTVAIVLLILL